MQESDKQEPEMSVEKQRNKKKKNKDKKEASKDVNGGSNNTKSASSIQSKAEKNLNIKESDEKKQFKKSKGKVVFDEELVTKNEAQNLIMERDYDSNKLNNPATDENQPEINKKKKKKRKLDKQLNHQSSDLGVNNEETSEKIVSKKKKENVTSQNDDEDASEEGADGDKPEVEEKESMRAQKRARHLKLLEEKKLKSELNMQEKCLNYLSQWKHDKSTWKFEKLKQVWLLQNLYDDAKIPDEFWNTTVSYFSSAKGRVKEVLLAETLKIIENSDQKDGNDADVKYERARDLVQNLQE